MGCTASAARDSSALEAGAIYAALGERDAGAMAEALRGWEGREWAEGGPGWAEEGADEMGEAAFPLQRELGAAFHPTVAETFSLLLSPYRERVARLLHEALCGPRPDQALLLTVLLALPREELPPVAEEYASLFGRELLPLLAESQGGPGAEERLVYGWVFDEKAAGDPGALARELAARYRAGDAEGALRLLTGSDPAALEAAGEQLEAENARTMLTLPALLSGLFSGLGLYGLNLLLQFQVRGRAARAAAERAEQPAAPAPEAAPPAPAFAYALHHVLAVAGDPAEQMENQLRALAALGSTRCPRVAAAYAAQYGEALGEAIRRGCGRLAPEFVDVLCVLWERGPAGA